MSAMADYEIWLDEHGLADSDDNQAAYAAERDRDVLLSDLWRLSEPAHGSSATGCAGSLSECQHNERHYGGRMHP